MLWWLCSAIHLYLAVTTLYKIVVQALGGEGEKRIKLGERAQYSCLEAEAEDEGGEEGDNARTTLLRESDEGEMV